VTEVLIAYADVRPEIRVDDLDLDRLDVVHSTIDARAVGILDLPDAALRILYDADPAGRRPNLVASVLLYVSERRPVTPIRGDALIVGLTLDGAATDVPEDLAALFADLAALST
jgi:hypothetical protein